ncbi:MAG: RdgB/HAM1 family non-canonical purine NTP pyrophosphatase [Lachnospiraceae bacterium]|nr:RdgB/HAM1 family non-canonical purine NTP pyrophosphatase [Lachnospiraceae bacterium]
MKHLFIIATGNKGKIREIRDIITDPDAEVLSMREAGVEADPDETGTTFEENALIKARAVSALICQKTEDGTLSFDPTDTQIIVMSDDSGLVVDALGGEPGIYSARYLGYDTDYNYKMEQIMKRMEDVPEEERTARFVAAVAAIFPDGTEHVVRGTMEGVIAHSINGQNGFGYDPFFYLPEYGKTSAEITEEEKNEISHRGKAFRAMIALYHVWCAENGSLEEASKETSGDGTAQ